MTLAPRARREGRPKPERFDNVYEASVRRALISLKRSDLHGIRKYTVEKAFTYHVDALTESVQMDSVTPPPIECSEQRAVVNKTANYSSNRERV